MKTLIKTALATLLFAGSHFANATLVTIEPDDYAVGAVVGTEDATLRFVTGGRTTPLTYSNAVAAIHTGCGDYPCPAPTGTKSLWDGGAAYRTSQSVTGNFHSHFAPYVNGEGPPGEYAPSGTFSALRVDFDSPVNYFDALMFGGSVDGVNLFAYSTTGQLLYSGQYWGTRITSYHYQFDVRMTRETNDIAYLFIGGFSAAKGIDRIRYDVPEPATFGIMALGLFGVVGMRRKHLRN
jgi:hypothetical protein